MSGCLGFIFGYERQLSGKAASNRFWPVHALQRINLDVCSRCEAAGSMADPRFGTHQFDCDRYLESFDVVVATPKVWGLS